MEEHMNCPFCNKDGQSTTFKFGCCKETGKMSFERYLQLRFGDAMLSTFHPRDYEKNLQTIHHEVAQELAHEPLQFNPFDFDTDSPGDYFERNLEVLAHYCNQLTQPDCKTM